MEEETSEELEIVKQKSNGGNSKQSLIWGVGKKIVMGGVMITSAPFLLPPLIVVSTVGFAFSVPFGLVFAGYACTEKVMSKLLSRPRVEEIKEDGLERDEEEFESDVKKTLEMRIELIEDEYRAREDHYGESKENMEEEDYSVEEDSQKWIQLERSECPNPDMVGVMDNIEQDVKEVLEEEVGKGISGHAVEEGVGGIKDEEVDNQGEKIFEGFVVHEGVAGVEEGGNEKLNREVNKVMGFMGDESVGHKEIQMEDAYDGVEEVEESAPGNTLKDKEVDTPVEETNGSIGEVMKKLVEEAEGDDKQTTDVYSLDNSITNEAVPTEENAVNVEGKENEANGAAFEQDEKAFDGVMEGVDENDIPNKELEPIGVEEMVEDMIVNRMIDEIVAEEKPVVDTKEMMEERSTGDTEDKIASDDIGHVEGKEVKVIPIEEEVKVTLIKENATYMHRLDKSITKEEVPTEETRVNLKEKKTEANGTAFVPDEKPIEGVVEGVDENNIPNNESEPIEVDEKIKEENPVVDTKEMMEERKTVDPEDKIASGDDNEVSPATDSYYISQSMEFSSVPRHVRFDFSEEQISDGLSAESVDSVVHPVSPKSVETQPAEPLPEMETGTPLKEVLYTEERIWELTDAMRKIVGYKGVVQPNIAEELKALYTFIGVEPPVALKDPLELTEANDKLRILMAIVGVK